MTVKDLIQILSADVINLSEPDRELSTGYAGDLLSLVMGRAPCDCAWFTIMTNVNILAVATLADCACVVICEGSQLMDGVSKKAKEQGINLIVTKFDMFTAIKKVVNEGQI